MLFRELKMIVEAEDAKSEPKLDSDGNPIIEPKKVVKKSKKQKEIENNSSDGLGNEAADMADKLAALFDTQDIFTVNGSSINSTSADNTVVLKGAAKAKTRDGVLADPETILNTLQLLVKAKMGDDFDRFNLGGIDIVGPDLILTVNLKPTTQNTVTSPVESKPTPTPVESKPSSPTPKSTNATPSTTDTSSKT